MKNRIERLQKLLKINEIDGFVVHDPISLFYLTGNHFEAAHLLISEKKALFVLAPMYEQMSAPQIKTVWAKDVPFQQFFHTRSSRKMKIGFNSQVVTVETLHRWKKDGKTLLFKPSSLIQDMRQIKDEDEIAFLKKATELAKTGMDLLQSHLEPHITELDLEDLLHQFLKKHRGAEVSFKPTIAFSQNTSFPHHRPTNTALKEGDAVLIDMGVKLDNYCSDITRTFCLGEMPKELSRLYAICKEAHDGVLDICHIGTPLEKLYETAFKIMEKQGVSDRFLHALGHSIGLSVHEAPIFRKKMKKGAILQDGMVFTIEPGLYLPSRYGARYENMILMQQGKPYIL